MIKTNSPYYINIPLDINTNPFDYYKMYIHVWKGLQSSEPLIADYETTRQNVENTTGFDKLNIANLINDFIEFEPQDAIITDIVDGFNQVWVSIYYEGFILDVSQGKTQLLLDSAISGYGYGLEGENTTTPVNKILMNGNEFKVSRNTKFIMPFIGDGSNIILTSYPDNEINTFKPTYLSTNSNSYVSYLMINCNDTIKDKYIDITYNGNTITLFVQNEYRYTPIDIHFKNKEGCQQVLTFLKERKDNISITSEKYNSGFGQPSLGFHQFTDYNVNSKTTFTVNSGFVDENMNETFKQLLLSDRIWAYENGKFIPLNIESKQLEFKTRVNDRLINYAINFGYSFNDINTI